jgi:hypothetical protein
LTPPHGPLPATPQIPSCIAVHVHTPGSFPILDSIDADLCAVTIATTRQECSSELDRGVHEYGAHVDAMFERPYSADVTWERANKRGPRVRCILFLLLLMRVHEVSSDCAYQSKGICSVCTCVCEVHIEGTESRVL